MNFISKILKKPNSKQDVKSKRKNKHRNRRSDEEEYIDVELELEEEERPEVPLFIGGAGGGKSPNDAGSALTGDDFLEEEEDDLELGEEAGTLYVKQHQQHHNPHDRSSGNLGRPMDGRPPSFGPPRQSQDAAFYAPEPPPYIAPPSMPMHQFPPEIVEPPYYAHSSSGYMDPYHGYNESTMPEYGGMPPPQMIPPGPMTPYYPPRVTPTTSFHHPAPSNYLGFTDTEMFDFQQLVSSGVPEVEAMRTIEYNRLLHHQNSGMSRSMQHMPPSILDEEEQIYQIILKESVEEERKRQERFRQRPERYNPQHNYAGLSTEEALTIALQQSQDDFERSRRSQATTPASSRPLGASRSVSQNTISLDIERANEDALRQAILLSLQEAEAKQTPVTRRFPHPTPMIPRDQTNHLEAQSARYMEFSQSRSPIPTNGHSHPQLHPTNNDYDLRPEYPQPSPLARNRSGGPPTRSPPPSQGGFYDAPGTRFHGRQQSNPVSQEYPQYSPYEESHRGNTEYGTNQSYEEYSDFPPQDDNIEDFPQEYPYDDGQYEEAPPEAEARVAASTMPVATLMSRLFPATEDEGDRPNDYPADDEPAQELQYQYQEQHEHHHQQHHQHQHQHQQSGGHHAAHMIMAHHNPQHRSLQGHANNPQAERSNRAILSLQSQSLDSNEVPASRKPFQSKLSMASMASSSSDNGGDFPSERAIVVNRLRSRQGDNYLSDNSGSSATNVVRRGSAAGRPGGPARQFTAPRSALTTDDAHNK